jgi:hypothetical protein
MKKALNLILEDQDIIELMRILIDDDAEGALVFLKRHFKCQPLMADSALVDRRAALETML